LLYNSKAHHAISQGATSDLLRLISSPPGTSMNITLDPQSTATRWRDANSKRTSPRHYKEDVDMLSQSAGPSSYFHLPAAPASSSSSTIASQQQQPDSRSNFSQATPRHNHPALPTEQTSIFSDNRAFAAALANGNGSAQKASSPYYSAGTRQPLTPPKRASTFNLPSTANHQSPTREFEWSPSLSPMQNVSSQKNFNYSRFEISIF